ncbi:response regulator [Paenibacillus sp. ISL-20]|nr:response regulator [Paenibacillus sp. ISL-20]
MACGFREIFHSRLKTVYNGVDLGLNLTNQKKGRIQHGTYLASCNDECKVIEFMESFLRQEGFQIITAATGTEALAKARDFKPSLVILDWMLPELSGIEVCRELRKSSRVGIIMVTARIEETDKLIGLEVGADDYRLLGIAEADRALAQTHTGHRTTRSRRVRCSGSRHLGG